MHSLDNVPGVHTVKLPLVLKGNSETEVPLALTFSTGSQTTAEVGHGKHFFILNIRH